MRAKAKKILVIGGAGYVGCVVVDELLRRGYAVRVFDRLIYGDHGLREVRDRVEVLDRRHARHGPGGVRRRRRRDQPRRPLQRPDGRVQPRRQLPDEHRRDRGVGQAGQAGRRAALHLRVLVLDLRPGRRGSRRGSHPRRGLRGLAARRLLELEVRGRAAPAAARRPAASVRSCCARGRCTAGRRGCASTWWSTPSSRTR